MEPPFTSRAALLQALRQGPGYGLELVERILEATGQRLALGSLYPALEGLKREGLVRSWTVAPGRGRGRSRTYHELTYAGLLRAEADARALKGLLSPRPRPARVANPSPAMLRRRLAETSDLIAFVEDVRPRMRQGR